MHRQLADGNGSGWRCLNDDSSTSRFTSNCRHKVCCWFSIRWKISQLKIISRFFILPRKMHENAFLCFITRAYKNESSFSLFFMLPEIKLTLKEIDSGIYRFFTFSQYFISVVVERRRDNLTWGWLEILRSPQHLRNDKWEQLQKCIDWN